jgi:hypothetical protein
MFAGVDGLANWIYKKVRVSVCFLEETESEERRWCCSEIKGRDVHVYVFLLLTDKLTYSLTSFLSSSPHPSTHTHTHSPDTSSRTTSTF